jgi:hypothetical protein
MKTLEENLSLREEKRKALVTYKAMQAKLKNKVKLCKSDEEKKTEEEYMYEYINK